jgi:hypothetical protein
MKKQIPVLNYSRVVGYFSPTVIWNPGKQTEKADRHEYTQEEIKQALEKNNETQRI